MFLLSLTRHERLVLCATCATVLATNHHSRFHAQPHGEKNVNARTRRNWRGRWRSVVCAEGAAVEVITREKSHGRHGRGGQAGDRGERQACRH